MNRVFVFSGTNNDLSAFVRFLSTLLANSLQGGVHCVRAGLHNPYGTPKRTHRHMFRDTFAVEMLLAGVPIDQVSILLGHSSVRIAEKHYSPRVRARQVQFEKSVQAAWQLLPGRRFASCARAILMLLRPQF